MDTKITEIIPDDLPEWAIEAMARGQLFHEIVKREGRVLEAKEIAEELLKFTNNALAIREASFDRKVNTLAQAYLNMEEQNQLH